jgi:hypothetical protein
MKKCCVQTAERRELLYLKFGFRKYDLSDLTINLFLNNKKEILACFRLNLNKNLINLKKPQINPKTTD